MPSPAPGRMDVGAALQHMQRQVDQLTRRLYGLAHLDQSDATDGQVPTWNDTSKHWEPGDVVSAVVIPVLHGDPATLVEGMIWFDLDATC